HIGVNSGFQSSIQKKSPKGSLRSLSKLMIGSMALGLEELTYRIKIWDEKSQPHQLENDSDHPSNQQGDTSEKIVLVPYEIIDGDLPQDDLRYVLIGLIFDTQERLISTTHKVGQIGGVINRFTYPFIKPFKRNWLIPPLRRRYGTLIERGENELNRLSIVGRSEYEQSRRMAQIAFDDSFEEAVDSLATNPEVQDLIEL
ncbi:unnamed protein product, partial [marine sediment metagenome]